MKVFDGIGQLAAAAGLDLGRSAWIEIDQTRIDDFAAATGDHQWIHVDPDAAARGPFGGTIAHGFLTLSLLPVLWQELYEVRGVRMAVNYGLGKVRFINPVRSGAKIRAAAVIAGVETLQGAIQLTLRTTVEIDGQDKPAAVVESIVRFVG